MKKRKRATRQRRTARKRDDRRVVVNDPRAMERTMGEYARVLAEGDFRSTEEANAFMKGLLESGGPPPRERTSPLEQAQDVMYDAFEAYGRKRARLARQALEISEDCADAYVLLAEEEARSLDEATRLYEQGVRAGARALGREAFERDAGGFWTILETRPYMRARLGLAQCLWLLGEREQAIAHLTEMLRLNPGDNQGIRYLLITALLMERKDEAAGRLLDQYQEDVSAAWLYSRALLLFRREGAGGKATAALKEALEANPFVPPYLTGLNELPASPPAYAGFGDEDEAITYTFQGFGAWDETEGAMDWLFETYEAEDTSARVLLHDALVGAAQEQVSANDPPEARMTFKRLQQEGYARKDALQLIASALAEEMHRMVKEDVPYDRERYARHLDELH